MKNKFIYAIMILLSISCYAQNTTIHFFYGSSEMLGSEIMFLLRGTETTYLGGGFSGALNQSKAEGEMRIGHINDYDLSQKQLGHINEQWCSLYAVGSLGFFKSVLIKYKAGLAVYNKKVSFEAENPSTLEPYTYNKIDEVLYRPLVGIGAMYTLTQDVGIEVGVDNFNKFTIGFTVLF